MNMPLTLEKIILIKKKERGGTFYPMNMHMDKELAILNSIKKIFPQTKIRLCYFHFSNNIKKRINNNIFKELFNSNIISLQCVLVVKHWYLFQQYILFLYLNY